MFRVRANHHRQRSRVGQALVETALLLPILLILLVGAVDLGRAFFGWVNLHQAARVAANYAATHPQDDYSNSGLEYYELIEREAVGINCGLEGPVPPTWPDGTRALGDRARAELTCVFDLITPIAAQLLDGAVTMRAEATFPIRQGCIDCPPASTPPPAPEPADLCRTIPTWTGLSLAGAQNAWLSAGFLLENFTAPPAPGTASIVTSASEPSVVDEADSGCTAGVEAIYRATVSVSVMPADPESPPTCITVPNLRGQTLEDAWKAWDDANFTGAITPAADSGENPLATVSDQTTTPTESTAGVSCAPADTEITLDLGAPWAVPPPPPCTVPSFTEGVRKNDAQALWTQEHFTSDVTLIGGSGNWLIKGQSLVGGVEHHCSVEITLYEVEPTP